MDSNEADTNETNVLVPDKCTQSQKSKEKTFQAQVNCVCKRECATKICVSRQQEIFEEFTKLRENWPQQTKLLRSLVVTKPVKEKLNPVIKLKNRDNIHEYHLIDESGALTPVCLSFFVNVFQISRKRVVNAVSSIRKNPLAIDQRGSGRKNQIDILDVKHLKEFIGELVTYESSRNNLESINKYLHPRITLRRMYQLYQELCVQANRTMLSESAFRKVFSSDFKLKLVNFAKPKCEICKPKKKEPGHFVQSTSYFEKQEQNTKQHDDLLRKVQNDLFKTVDTAKELSEKIEVYTFELLNAIDLPYLETSQQGDIYFKKQLWCFCVCLFDEVHQQGYFYVWNESIASHGTQEIASCLIKHFMNYTPNDTRRIVLFSDITHSQNRNIKMSLMLNQYLNLEKSELKSIEQHFFVRGHGQNSCNRSFQKVSSNLKPNEVFVPNNLNEVIQQAKFHVVQMKSTDFFSCDSLVQLIANYDKIRKLRWSDFQRVIYERGDGISFEVFNYGSDESRTIVFPTECAPDVYSKTKFRLLYPNGCPISKSKYDDLQNLLEFVPVEYHNFYHSLNYVDDDSIKDYGLVSSVSSDESSDKEN